MEITSGVWWDWVCEHWESADREERIWEVRERSAQHFCLFEADVLGGSGSCIEIGGQAIFSADRKRWLECRDLIYETILSKGWSQERNAFVQSFDSTYLSADVLIMPLVFFMSPTDPRMLRTIDAINRSPSEGGLVSGSLVFRYNVEASPDGLRGREGTFNMCTFWLVEALTRAGRFDRERLETARLIFERMLGYSNHLGLYAEQIGYSGEGSWQFSTSLYSPFPDQRWI